MGAGLPSLALGDADLHGLVDDCVPASRRAETMRKLAASPADRTRFESWRDQNDLIRSAFRDVDRESLPVCLDLRSPPRLQCIPAVESRLAAEPIRDVKSAAPQRGVAALVTSVVVAAGLGVSWLLLQSGAQSPSVDLRGSVDALLAAQAEQAVTAAASATEVVPQPTGTLPAATIPDLTSAGFAFTNAERLPSDPGGLVFHYQASSSERLAITVARSRRSVLDGPVRIGNSFGWRRGENLYAIAGTVPTDRLRDIAETIKSSLAE